MQTFFSIFSHRSSRYAGIVVVLGMLSFGYFTIDVSALDLNFGMTYTRAHIISHILLSVLLGWLVMLEVYKMYIYQKIQEKKSTILGVVGSVLGIIVTGCPVCGWTLISALGLTSILNVLPRYGLELKLLSVFILFRAQDILWTNMIVCQRFFLKKWIKKTHIVVSFIVLISSFFSLFLFFRPHKSIILPGDVVLYPTEDYTLFTYELDQGCSNSTYFIESYTATSKPAKILGLYVYDKLMIDAFATCKDVLIKSVVSPDDYNYIVSAYTDSNLSSLGSNRYFVEYSVCEDPGYTFCLEGKYYLVSENIIYLLVARYTSIDIINQRDAITALEDEVGRWVLK